MESSTTGLEASSRDSSPRRAPRAEWSVRTRLVILALSVALPAALALGLAALEGWRTARERTDGALTARTEALSAAIVRELAAVRGTLETLAASPALAEGRLDAFREQVGRTPRPAEARIGLTAMDGRMLVSSKAPMGTPLPPRGDPEVVRRVFETGEVQVSDLYRGSVTREHLVAVDVPVRSTEGGVAYDLNMGLRAASLDQVLTEQRLPDTWRAALLDGRGLVVARTHDSSTFIGRQATPLSMMAIAAGISPFDTVSHEGAPARGAHAAVPGTGWRVAVVVPQEELSAPLEAGLLAAAATGGGLLLLGLSGAAWQGRRIAVAFSALAQGASALGRGAEPVQPPRGVSEASRVGTALADAAAALAGREAERAEADRRQDILIRELNHRVKNTLATVQAIAAQTLRREGRDPALAYADLDERLRALARAHDLLVAGTWGDTPLPDVVRAALAPWTEAGRVRIACLCGTSFPTLRPAQAQALVLALHELATNAAKYGALSRSEGAVALCCAATEGGALVQWTEQGGPPVEEASAPRRGFGTRLLERALPRELGPGSEVVLDFAREGLRAEIRIRGTAQEPAGKSG
ncbi:Two-component sensor histidine kinase, contains HisKA and HATPase domains [Roseomonas rosea]|uniref:histidine kinase n=1 Tax=Muricoccus roseus TaxID=198092 RepID=A0A1M6BWY7_9PROT|nr:sensor histidine kinase [Roseomonas rosea]SHI53275.1 Two-component sensor histidine kinase, contains HisKA and HATPase domains [Roseomonas rosea]